ncbi:hypothetical protein NDU88_001243 [Pleurodeles waltl]|uniref:Uncharacterized protein n=1 Tax=Pleurodeles waltl TaxID=8319 RepID=A0AAV7WLC7_PLEWA|nr:hypothetical protein NDU88_001243 [Pleurodeles waltl]
MRSSGGLQPRPRAPRPPECPLFPGCPVPTPNFRSQPVWTRSFTRRKPLLTWKPLCLVGHRFLKHTNHSPPVWFSGVKCRYPDAGSQVSVLYHLVDPLRSRALERCPSDREPRRLTA